MHHFILEYILKFYLEPMGHRYTFNTLEDMLFFPSTRKFSNAAF